jgi:hypothetical protein
MIKLRNQNPKLLNHLEKPPLSLQCKTPNMSGGSDKFDSLEALFRHINPPVKYVVSYTGASGQGEGGGGLDNCNVSESNL